MEYTEVLLIIGVGTAAGFINAIAGGGSLLTLPVLIFMGLPSSMANATNRVAILMGAISSSAGFRSKGVSAYPYSLYLGLAASVGAVMGAVAAVKISGELFNRILAIIMILVVIQMIFRPNSFTGHGEDDMSPRAQTLGYISFFFIGIYGGFIQAGVGFLIMSALTNINKFALAKTNSAKVFSVLIYSIAAVIVFAIMDQIYWILGLTLAVGNVTGAWIGSRWSVGRGQKWIKWIMMVLVTVMALKLWFPEWFVL